MKRSVSNSAHSLTLTGYVKSSLGSCKIAKVARSILATRSIAAMLLRKGTKPGKPPKGTLCQFDALHLLVLFAIASSFN